MVIESCESIWELIFFVNNLSCHAYWIQGEAMLFVLPSEKEYLSLLSERGLILQVDDPHKFLDSLPRDNQRPGTGIHSNRFAESYQELTNLHNKLMVCHHWLLLSPEEIACCQFTFYVEYLWPWVSRCSDSADKLSSWSGNSTGTCRVHVMPMSCPLRLYLANTIFSYVTL